LTKSLTVSTLENEYLVAGFNGNGMPRCFAAGKTVAAMITGELSADSWIKSLMPSRIPHIKRNEDGEFDGFSSTGE